MSSLAPAQTPYKPISGKRTLQRLRREAGYRSAKEFAEALGIPGSTYARYERAGDGAAFGELVAFDSAEAARTTFESFLQEQAAKKRGRLSTKAQKIADDQVIEKIMAAYDRTHGEFDLDGMQVLWGSVDHGIMVEYDSEANGRGGDAKA